MRLNNKIVDWVNNSGEVVFKAKNGFTRAAHTKLKDRYGVKSSHMRIGRFSIILVNAGRDMIVGPTYSRHFLDEEGSVERHSKYWDMYVRDRIRQLDYAGACLDTSHP